MHSLRRANVGAYFTIAFGPVGELPSRSQVGASCPSDTAECNRLAADNTLRIQSRPNLQAQRAADLTGFFGQNPTQRTNQHSSAQKRLGPQRVRPMVSLGARAAVAGVTYASQQSQLTSPLHNTTGLGVDHRQR